MLGTLDTFGEKLLEGGIERDTVNPTVVGLVLVALARNRQREGPQVALRILSQEHLSPRSLLPLALAPLAATLVYAAAVALDLRWQTNWLVYLVTMPAGFVLFGVSWVRLMHRKFIAA